MLGHMSCDPHHVLYHGPPSPGLQDDYFELSESMLVLKLHDLRERITLTNVPSLLGPRTLSATSVASDCAFSLSSSLQGNSCVLHPLSAGGLKCVEVVGRSEVWEEDEEPTNTDWEDDEEWIRRQAEVKEKQKKGYENAGKKRFNKIPHSLASQPTSKDASNITKPDRAKHLNAIRKIIDCIPLTTDDGNTTNTFSLQPPASKNKKQPNTLQFNLFPLEGREISIPSPSSTVAGTQNNTSNLPPPPKLVRVPSTLKLRLLTPDDTRTNPSPTPASPTTCILPSTTTFMDERQFNTHKNLRTAIDTAGSDATSATASLSNSSGPSVYNGGTRKPTVKGDEEDDASDDDDDDDDEEMTPMRAVTEEGECHNDNDDGDNDGQKEDAHVDGTVLLAESIDWIKPRPGSRQSQALSTSLDLARSSSFTSSVRVEGRGVGGNDKEPEEGESRSYHGSPIRQDSVHSLELVRSSSLSSSVRETGVEDMGDNSVGGASNISVVRKKRLSWRIGIMRSRRQQKELDDDSVLSPPPPLTRMISPNSIDSGVTPSQWQWQERSLSSLTTTVSEGLSTPVPAGFTPKSLPNPGSSPTPSSTKKKRRKWKIGRRSKSSRRHVVPPPTTLVEEEEEEEQLPWRRNKSSRLPQESPPPTILVKEDEELHWRPNTSDTLQQGLSPSHTTLVEQEEELHWRPKRRDTLWQGLSPPPTTLMEEEEYDTLRQGLSPSPTTLVEEEQELHWRPNTRDTLRQGLSPPPTTLMEEEEYPAPVEQRQLQQKHHHRQHRHKRVIIQSTDVVTTDTARRRDKRRAYPHHQYKLQQIKRNHKAILSDELFMKLAEEEDFDDFIKLNRISFAGDMLLGRMLRERTRIQCKRDMLHSELDTYAKVHCRNSAASGTKSSSGCSDKSDDRSVLFSI